MAQVASDIGVDFQTDGSIILLKSLEFPDE